MIRMRARLFCLRLEVDIDCPEPPAVEPDTTDSPGPEDR